MDEDYLCSFYDILQERKQESTVQQILYVKSKEEEASAYNSDDEVYEVASRINNLNRKISEDGRNIDKDSAFLLNPVANVETDHQPFYNFVKNLYKEHEDIKSLTLEQVSKLRNEDYNVVVAGVSVERPIASFSHLRGSIPTCVLERLGMLGIFTPTSIQSQAITCGLAGRDILGTSPTGSGKTIAFLLPLISKLLVLAYYYKSESFAALADAKEKILCKLINNSNTCDTTNKDSNANNDENFNHQKQNKNYDDIDIIGELNNIMRQNDHFVTEECSPYALILCPTRELALQIDKQFKWIAKETPLRSSVLIGGMNKTVNVKELKKGVEMVVGNVGRIIDMANRGFLRFRNLYFLVLDEADRMLSLGFEQQVRSIVNAVRPDRETYMFSATMPPKIENLARDILKNPVRITVGKIGECSENIEQNFVLTNDESQKKEWIVSNIVKLAEKGKILVFCNSQSRVVEIEDLIAKVLMDYNNQLDPKRNEDNNLENHDSVINNCRRLFLKSGVLYGDMKQHERLIILNNFSTGKINILVSSDVTSRGIHVKDIACVINYEVCDNIELYLHRVGRTGRVNNKGIAYTLLSQTNDKTAALIIENLEMSGKTVPQELLELALNYAPFRSARLEGTMMQQKFERNPKASNFFGLGFKSSSVPEKNTSRKSKECNVPNKNNPSNPSVPHATNPGFLKKKIKSAMFVQATNAQNFSKENTLLYNKSKSRWDNSENDHINNPNASDSKQDRKMTQKNPNQYSNSVQTSGLVINPYDELSSSSDEDNYNHEHSAVDDRRTSSFEGISCGTVVGHIADNMNRKRSRWGS